MTFPHLKMSTMPSWRIVCIHLKQLDWEIPPQLTKMTIKINDTIENKTITKNETRTDMYNQIINQLLNTTQPTRA